MLRERLCFAEGLYRFRQLIGMMAGKCPEPLNRRNSSAYAGAYSYFYMQMRSAGIQVFGDGFEQSIPIEVGFVPMIQPTGEGAVFIAEKAAFSSLVGSYKPGTCHGKRAPSPSQLRTGRPF